jgi:hypothetical protein
MASAEDYANWIVKNADKKGTPEFETVAKAYQLARSQSSAGAPVTREQESQAELDRLNKMVAEKGAPVEGMPASRAPSGFEQSEFYQRTKNAPDILTDVIRPFDVGENIGAMAQQAADFGKAGSERFTAGLASGRPLDVVTGAGQNILGGMGIAFSPLSGLTKTFIADPLARTFGSEVGERAQIVSDIAAGPKMVTAAARPIVWAGNKAIEGATTAQNIIRPKTNWLAEAVGEQGPDIVNALRSNVSGVEGAGQAAAPAGSVSFSQFAKALEKYAPQIADDAAATQDALLAARSNMAEGRMAEGSRKLADVVAEPDMQKVGDKLISLANKEKKTSRQTVTGPAYNEFVAATEGQGTDISNITRKASELIDTIDQDAAAVLSRRLKKYQPTSTQTSGVGAGGAEYNIKTGEIPPLATAEDLNDIRSAINDAIGAAKAKNAAADLRRLNNLRQEVDKAVLNSTTFSDEAKAAWENANKVYSEQYVPRFKTGLQENLFKLRGNETAIASEDVVAKFMAGPTEVDQFVALFGKNPEAMNYARQGVEGMFRNAAIKNGVIDSKAAETFFKKYGAQIDALDAQGLNIRNKLNALVKETARVTAPESRIAETRGAIKGGKLPAGASETKTAARVDELVNATSAEDLTALRDAVEIARRRGRFEEQAAKPVAKEFQLPSAPPVGSDFLNLAYRIPIEVYRRVTGKLTSKAAKELGELLSDPTRLDEAADLIEKAVAMKSRQTGRKFGPVTAPPFVGVPAAAVNALAPPSQNSLATQTGQ